ncbi:MAG: ATP-binding protein [Acidimicrobiaceae bacterium]|uniref:ATP-binding protein n=1 Tax=Candidatus Poriferisodalis multihospitum TaxID=2983191 RepID=UPI0023A17F76|nr:ATP-binding protein [Candidatus Poriferisodalis multihospitum]MDE0135543.1 ATP-binding protein [Acidimicrobiaceae bacterium]MDE0318543.1 ATP-binding protein [Acidimicrobiaceae bacterium]MDE0497342.1 ATP-binding protein [Acidimicrobiaceae bacterium]
MRRSLNITPVPGAAAAEALPRIVAFVEEMAELDDWAPDLVLRSNLILEELILNTLTHGRTSGLSDIEITLESGPDSVAITLVDDGAAFDPLTDETAPGTDLPLAERSIGGLGLHLVRTMAEDLTYQHADGKNHLSLVARSGI